jgi:hypothetical protein
MRKVALSFANEKAQGHQTSRLYLPLSLSQQLILQKASDS